MSLRMTPKQYFAVRDRSSPPLFHEVPHEYTVSHLSKGYVIKENRGVALIDEVPTIPANGVDHTALIIGVVAIVGLVILGLAFLSKK